jgi:hypothetical protein
MKFGKSEALSTMKVSKVTAGLELTNNHTEKKKTKKSFIKILINELTE